MEHGKIGGRQLMYLVVVLVFSTAVMAMPALSSRAAQQNAWLSGVLAMAYGALLSLPLGYLARRFPGETPAQYGPRLLGPVLGRIAPLGMTLLALHLAALLAREFGELMTSALMPETPIIVLVGIHVWLAATLARSGIELIGRLGELWLPFLLGLTGLTMALALVHANWEELLPVLDHGWRPVAQGALPPVAWLSEATLLLFACGSLRESGAARPALLKGLLLSGLVITLTAVVNTVVFGPEQLARQTFPTLNLARLVDVAHFIARIESLTITLWMVGTLIKLALFLHTAALGLAQTSGLPHYQPLVYPLGALVVGLGMGMFPHLPALLAFVSGPALPYALTMELGWPLLLLLAALCRGDQAAAPLERAP